MDEPTYEYRVWCETGDLVYAGADRAEAVSAGTEAIKTHVVETGCTGCGVLTPADAHGFSVQVCDGDSDVTAHVNIGTDLPED